MDSVRMHPPKAKGISFIIDEEAKEISERISNEGGGEQNQSSLSPLPRQVEVYYTYY